MVMTLMDAQAPDSPVRMAWEQFKLQPGFADVLGVIPEVALPVIWIAAYQAATERAVQIHNQVGRSSDEERLNGVTGTGASGAVDEYRDLIRGL